VSIAAKTLSGFGYRGHVFWDTEIFVLPFFIFTQPAIARNLLLYRYHTLPGARQKAAENGLEGAMFAWESAATGKETTPRWVPGPGGLELIRIWCGDIELHISADIAYAVMQYWQVTGDDDFMRDYGAEIVLDTARFWGSRAEWNAEKGVYEILNVIGPDEYHDHVDNNAFTNNLARWNLQAAQRVLEWLQHEVPQKAGELVDALNLSPQRLEHWQDVIDKLALGFNPDTGLFEQFEGFYDRKAVDLDEFEPRQKSLQALLGIAGVQEYQILKQPDVLMLLYLLRSQYNSEILRSNWEFYTPRTDLSYGSSLGPAIHAILAVETGHVERGYRHFMHAASTDLTNARGNSQDGIHAATAGGLWQAAIFGFGGLRLGSEGLNVEAHLPVEWQRLQFKIRYRGKIYAYNLNRRSASAGQNPRMATGVPQPAFPIQGAIFDLDGVLTDTSELHYQAWKRLADEEGLPFNRKDNEALRGIPRRESLLLILKGRELPEEKIQELMRRKNHYYQESIQNLTPGDLLPGAPQFLRDVRSNGVKIAIGSASKNARAVIDKLGIGSLIDAISDGNSVNRQKPAPDLFLHAASQLSVEPHHCVVFEDAESGVAAALAGGMWAVGIGPQSRVGEAHLVISGLNEVTWPDLLERLQVHLEQPQGL
jgi:kojibiose phosphorylase